MPFNTCAACAVVGIRSAAPWNARFSGVIYPASTECSICEFWVIIAPVTEIPIALPTLRNRLSSAVPSVRSAGSSVAKAITCSGMNTNPRPAPCRMVLTTMVVSDTAGVQSVIRYRLQDSSTMPNAISSLASTLFDSRPAISIAPMVPKPRGAITSPAVSTG